MIAGAAFCLAAPTARAFDLPEAEAASVRVEIRNLDQMKRTAKGYNASTFGLTIVTAGVDRVFDVSVKNKGASSVRGRFSCRFNDGDWSAMPDKAEEIELSAGEERVFRRKLRASGKPIRGVYPVHAVFEPQGRPADTVDAVGFFYSFVTNRPFFYAGPKKRLPGKTPAKAAAPVGEEILKKRAEAAVAAAREALDSPDPSKGRYRLDSGRETTGAAIVPGERGMLDGVIAFFRDGKHVTIRGFEVSVDDRRIPGSGAGLVKVSTAADGDSFSVTHFVDFDYIRESVPLRVTFRAERGGLRAQWDMPGVKRHKNGSPHYTHLAAGPAGEKIKRVYAGFGNVLEDPKDFILRGRGFSLSTRHIGVDYDCGMSLVSAVGLSQERLECRPKENFCSIVTFNDALITFVPSLKGAFAAARSFSDISGYRKGPGVDAVNGTFSMDNGPADYQRTAWAMDAAARYGITNGVFIKHHWQRYGYDIRLPDTCPPRGDLKAFMNMVEATKRAGIRFCPHDNYSDFYADAEGYTFNHIRFFPDGTAWLAWGAHPGGRRTQSYKWLPMASLPFSKRNYGLMRDIFAPDALFIDVLGVEIPKNCFNRNGEMLTADVMYESHRRSFDLFREVTGQPDAPTFSETGADNLIGHLDGGETDHFAADRNYDWLKREQYGDSQRVPWHDMVSHGKFVMLGGGMGLRYSGYDSSRRYRDDVMRGYGSDDYLATTVMGGRTPASGGPCDRRTVLTAWMVGDVCSRLAKEDFEEFHFEGTIHRYRSVFSGGGEVWVNRQTNRLWTVAGGMTLGHNGFYAKIGDSECGSFVRDGLTTGFAWRPGVAFLDARVPAGNGNAAELAECEVLERLPSDNPRRLKLNTAWTFYNAPTNARPFVFVVPPGRTSPTLANGWFDTPLPMDKKWPYRAEMKMTVPINDSIKMDEVDIIWGAGGPDCRFAFSGRNCPAYADSVRAGRLKIRRNEKGRVVGLDWTKYDPEAEAADWGLNVARKSVTYRGLETDGALRLEHSPRPGFFARLAGKRLATWRLTPLPGSLPFTTKIDLAAFSAAGAEVKSVTAVGPKRVGAGEPVWKQNSDRVEITVDGLSFAYEISFK